MFFEIVYPNFLVFQREHSSLGKREMVIHLQEIKAPKGMMLDKCIVGFSLARLGNPFTWPTDHGVSEAQEKENPKEWVLQKQTLNFRESQRFDQFLLKVNQLQPYHSSRTDFIVAQILF